MKILSLLLLAVLADFSYAEVRIQIKEVLSRCEGENFNRKSLALAQRSCRELIPYSRAKIIGYLREEVIAAKVGDSFCPVIIISKVEGTYHCGRVNYGEDPCTSPPFCNQW